VGTKKKEIREGKRPRGAKPGTPKHQAKPVQKGGSRYRIVLVSPEIPGNLGFVARVMANFGVEDLVLVNGCEITEEARDRAVHAQQILDNARRARSLGEALKGTSLSVATTANLSLPDKSLQRNPLTIRDARKKILRARAPVALVFGRESRGLLNDELERLDLAVTIPTNDAYPSLNVSHAMAIVLYELSNAVRTISQPQAANRGEREALLDRFDELERASHVPDWRIKRNRVMIRRLIGRSSLTKWEFHALSGVLTRPAKQLKRRPAFKPRK